MEDFTIAIYCFIDDYLKIGHPKEGARRKLNDAQIITTALVAARYFSGNFVKPPSGARRQVSEVADRVESNIPEAPELQAKKPRRNSCPGPLKNSRSLGMNYEIKNWDILCGRGRGKLASQASACTITLVLPITNFFLLCPPQATLSTLGTSASEFWSAAICNAI